MTDRLGVEMITCKECLERCYPSNPQLDGGCVYYCDKPTYYRELEAQNPPEQIIIHRHSNMSQLESDLLQLTALRAVYLQKKLNERQSFSKRIKYK